MKTTQAAITAAQILLRRSFESEFKRDESNIASRIRAFLLLASS